MKSFFIAILSLACVACSSGGEPSERVITIVIEHSAFEPKTIEVEQGSTVTFVIQNSDPIAHEFILGDDEIQRIHEKGTEKHHGARPGEVSIPGGATRTTTYTFEGATDLEFACHLPGHYAYGMRGAVKVK